MVNVGVPPHSASQRLHALYDDGGEPSIEVLREIAAELVSDEDSLADFLESDGRLRIARRLPLDLSRYFNAVPDLPEFPEALDAAIDVVLRSRYEREEPQEQAVEALIAEHPDLATQIRESAALSNAIWSTSGLRTRLALPPTRPLPCDFGPLLTDGQRRYNLTRLLGEGAFGQVYLAVDRHLSEDDHDALVAIKILAPPSRGPWTRQSLIDEAAKARRVDHANVVRVLDRNTTDAGEDYIIYEFIDGGDMAKWIRRQQRPIPVPKAVSIMAQVARGVQAAHAAGLVHCDLKPGNIMVTTAETPKVADFGVAVRFGDRRQAGVRSGQNATYPIGNIAFIAPEQFRMEAGALSVPADVYALGGMLYLVLTGELPSGSTIEAIRDRHEGSAADADAPSPRALRTEVDGDLDRICRRALSTNPGARHRSAGELADDLESWIKHEPIKWMNPSPLRIVSLWVQRRPVVAALSVVLLLSAIAATVGFNRARIAEQRAADEARWKDEARHEVGVAFRQGFPNLRQRANHAQEEILATLWLLEMTYGPKLIDDPDLAAEIRRARIDYFTEQVEQARADGKNDTLAAMHWVHGLAFLLLMEHRGHEARTLLNENEQRWQRILDGDDPWFDDLNALGEVADAQVALRDGTGNERARRMNLSTLASNLSIHAEHYGATQRRSPMQRLILRTLVEINGPDGLDDEDAATAARTTLQDVEDE